MNERGYKVIVNSKRFKIVGAISAHDLGLSLSDMVSLCYACAGVFSLRSGLCDLLAGMGGRLYAFYPAMLIREMHGLNRTFDLPSPVNEIGLHKWKIDPVIWNGEDLTPAFQAHVDWLRTAHWKARLKARFAKPNKKRIYAFWGNIFALLGFGSGPYVDNNVQKPELSPG